MPRNILNSLIIALLVFVGGGCTKRIYVPTESQSESVRYIEKEVVHTLIDTVEVVVEIPAQSAMAVTPDTVSYLETDYAESFAKWSNGLLTHTISNKVVPIPKQIEVPRSEIERYIERTDTIVIRTPVEVPPAIYKPQNKWIKFKIDAFWWLLGGLAGLLAYLFRHPILNLIKCVL